jgi:rhodanese-related sulfurtransferase
MVKQVTVVEAHELQGQGHVYVDVRSSREFESGHPAGAFNIPMLEPDESTGQLQPNPDFVRVMQASFPNDAKLLLGCQMGGRSQRAAQILQAFGFEDVANVRGGFDGARDPMSGRVDSGWAESGLPVEDGHPPDRSYQSLLEKADGTA